MMCRVLDVSRSGYYRWLHQGLSPRKRQDAIIKEQIHKIFLQNRKTYGSPRIHKVLLNQGYRCGKKRVERLMKEAGLRVIQKRKYKVTTDSKHNLPVAENILNRKFHANRPNLSWVSDITYSARCSLTTCAEMHNKIKAV
jgi:putative transposase